MIKIDLSKNTNSKKTIGSSPSGLRIYCPNSERDLLLEKTT